MSDAPVNDAADGVAVLAILSETPLDAELIERFVISRENGALVTFRGIVRDHDGGRSVRALDYTAHPDALRFLQETCQTIAEQTGLRIAAAHRTGALQIGDTALVAAVAAPHRAEAFAACEALVDLIKQTVPIWKRQHIEGGKNEWVGL